ncbi:hypothetical protein [Bradyrhizobium sp. sBnM-33]|uniref:hypothetical protein n=1 Tax=Bradyrhizobium sp. sBnM-33 TaxID=2831780 RepID=UPI001BCDB8C9|nr:hypothetical protein [Bradyrhizobium sp. sBnM-33]WOH48102.1 hypothetical protein RX328_28690 [Bradyrhizobium sp. sBnM-33]
MKLPACICGGVFDHLYRLYAVLEVAGRRILGTLGYDPALSPGKSLLIFRNRVKPKNQWESKIFCFRSHPNQSHNSARLTADEGRFAIVTNVR